MTQSKRRENSRDTSQRKHRPKQTQMGTLVVIGLVVLLFVARNYGFLPEQVNAAQQPPATVVISIAAPAEEVAEPTPEQITPTEEIPTEEIPAEEVKVETTTLAEVVIANDSSAQNNQLTLASTASEPEQKKATRTPKRTPKPTATVTPTRVKKPTATATVAIRRATATASVTPKLSRSQSGLPLIYYEDLPREAQQTIRLIDEGGPFPYSRDGIEFQNRERILPHQPRGYYSEYTVITPGSRDRGARRIVAGENGELYYTDDHYDSFSEVVR